MIFRANPVCGITCVLLLLSFIFNFNFILTPQPAWADKVYLKGETQPIEGKVLSVGQDEVLIQLPEGQQLPLIRQKVERVEMGQSSPTSSPVKNPPPLPEPPPSKPPPSKPLHSKPLHSKPSNSKPLESHNPASGHDPELRPLSNHTSPHHSLEQPITPVPPPLPIIQLEAEAATAEPVLEETTSQGNQFMMLAPNLPTQLPQFSSLSEEMFVSLSRFKGKITQNQYAGLYNFPQRGTFWIRFPSPATEATPLQFTLFGKQHKANAKSTEVTLIPGPEAFILEVRFLTDQGEPIGKPEQVSYKPQAGQLVEWFHLLENMSGLCDPMILAVTLPQNTKVVEFRVINGNGSEGSRHLVGYLGQIQVGQAEIRP